MNLQEARAAGLVKDNNDSCPAYVLWNGKAKTGLSSCFGEHSRLTPFSWQGAYVWVRYENGQERLWAFDEFWDWADGPEVGAV